MKPTTLAAILARHAAWCRDEPGGERANLLGADLRWADLGGANLRWADLSGADLRGVMGVDAEIIAAATGATP